MINGLTRIKKSKYYKTYFSEHKTNFNKNGFIKVSLINVKIKSNQKIASLNIKNQIETSPKTRD